MKYRKRFLEPLEPPASVEAEAIVRLLDVVVASIFLQRLGKGKRTRSSV
jgi:hypothetical protein